MKPILEIQNISKKFRINHEQQPYLSLRDSITTIFKNKSIKEDFWALKDVSFDVMPGDTVGIIGKNGAGKSTLLKVLSKITPPTSGKIISRGRIASLLEVGTGFHPELSGRENVFMNGSILGMRRTEIQKNFDAIVDFAGVEKFIDEPLKHYSSGMQLRLAFAVAAFLENEILIIDEVLAVGDVEFQKKCMGKMEDVSKSGRTILFVSHNIGAVSTLCKTGVLLNEGKVDCFGNSSQIIQLYLSNNLMKEQSYKKEHSAKDIYFSHSRTLNNLGKPTANFVEDETVSVEFEIKINKFLKDVIVAVALLDKDKKRIFTIQKPLSDFAKIEDTVIKLSVSVPSSFLLPGNYSWYFAMHIPFIQFVDVVEDINGFEIMDMGGEFSKYGNFNFGVIYSPANIRKIT